MSSPDRLSKRRVSSRADVIIANVRLGWCLVRAEWPPAVWLVGYLLPELMRMLVFVLIGQLVGGVDGLRFAVIGCTVLSIATTTVSQVTDIPVLAVGLGVYPKIAIASVSPFGQFFARAVSLWGMAMVVAVAVVVVLSSVTAQFDLIPVLLVHLWIVLPAVVSTTALGLVVIVPAVGSSWEGITYNGAIAILTAISGAIVAVDHPLIGAAATMLPMTHTIDAMRRIVVGEQWMASMLAECAVAAAWMCIAAGCYALQDARGRRLGRGAFVA